MKIVIIKESILFSLIMIIFSFLISYIGDIIQILLGKIKKNKLVPSTFYKYDYWYIYHFCCRVLIVF